MIIKNAKVFTEEGIFKKQTIYIENDRIVKDIPQDKTEIDGSGCVAIPGLTDIHFHGCVGYDFCDGTHEAFKAMAEYELKNGVTTICPATMTLAEDTLLSICEAAKTYSGDTGAELVGINMEGPFISQGKKGAQNGNYIQGPSIEVFKRLQEASGNQFKLVSIAPESPNAMEFIDELKDDIVMSIAHTTCDYDTAKVAMDKGALHITHLYNAMHPFTHRAPGPIGAAVDNPKCEVELICDGIHIHEAVVRTTLKMFGDDRVIFISDSMMATGMKDGNYSLGGQAVKVVGNLATLEDNTIAGSATNLMDCVRVAVKDMQVPLESAIKCAAVNSAKSIGIYDNYGSLSQGKIANVVLLKEDDLSIEKVIFKGKEIA